MLIPTNLAGFQNVPRYCQPPASLSFGVKLFNSIIINDFIECMHLQLTCRKLSAGDGISESCLCVAYLFGLNTSVHN